MVQLRLLNRRHIRLSAFDAGAVLNVGEHISKAQGDVLVHEGDAVWVPQAPENKADDPVKETKRKVKKK